MKAVDGDGSPHRLAVFGSRTLQGERVAAIIRAEIERHPVSMIVTAGDVTGVNQEARQLAQRLAIPLKVHFLNFRYKRGAFERRSQAILADCDHLLVIHDGQSQGTKNEMAMAKKLGRPTSYHVLTPTDAPTDAPTAVVVPLSADELLEILAKIK